MKKYLSLWVLLLSIVVFQACKEDGSDQLELGYDYFPLEVGNYIVYKVDSTIYSAFAGTVDSSTVYLKELVESSFIDNEGRESYRIMLYFKSSLDSNVAWNEFKAYASTITDLRAEKVEDNLRFIKLAFPVRNDQTWDGHRFIDPAADTIFEANNALYLGDWTYRYANVNEAANLSVYGSALEFDSTITVYERGDSNLIEYYAGKEVYAKNVGLVFREWSILWSQCRRLCPDDSDALCRTNCRQLPWVEKADGEYIVKIVAVEYGSE